MIPIIRFPFSFRCELPSPEGHRRRFVSAASLPPYLRPARQIDPAPSLFHQPDFRTLGETFLTGLPPVARAGMPGIYSIPGHFKKILLPICRQFFSPSFPVLIRPFFPCKTKFIPLAILTRRTGLLPEEASLRLLRGCNGVRFLSPPWPTQKLLSFTAPFPGPLPLLMAFVRAVGRPLLAIVFFCVPPPPIPPLSHDGFFLFLVFEIPPAPFSPLPITFLGGGWRQFVFRHFRPGRAFDQKLITGALFRLFLSWSFLHGRR